MKENSLKKRTGALAIAVVMLIAVFAPVSVSAQTETVSDETAVSQQETAVTDITLNRSEVSLKGGKQVRLQASLMPSDAAGPITWTSSDSNIAAIDAAGLVTAKKPGKAKITASAEGKSAACTIRVSLAAPAGVRTKSLGVHTIQIKWKKTAGADGYKIYRAAKKNGTYKKIAVVKGGSKLSYKNKKRITGKLYYYKVRAYSGSHYSSLSKRVSGKAKPAKTRVNLKSGEEKIRVSWEKVNGAQGYHIYRASSEKGEYKRVKIVKNGDISSFLHSGLTGGKTYHYKVRAYRISAGEKVLASGSAPVSVKAKKVKLKTSKKGFQYKKKFIVKAYSYTGGGRTASGTRARVGAIAVDPSVIPLGTKVYVDGYGYARAEDTGGNIKGKKIDVYKNSAGACMKWGVRYVTIYVDVRK